MRRARDVSPRVLGMTLVELAFSVSALSLLMGGMLVGFLQMQNAFLESQLVSRIEVRAQIALERIVALSSQAVTTDAQFSPLRPTTGIDSHALRFRLVQGIDAGTGQVLYDDTTPVFIYGPDSGSEPSRGLIIGRGSDLAAIHGAAGGADGFLGTVDDNVNVSLGNGLPAVELLLSEEFVPRTGEMFRINVSPPPLGRLLTFTLRVNLRDRSGDFLLDQDIVLSERVSLKQ